MNESMRSAPLAVIAADDRLRPWLAAAGGAERLLAPDLGQAVVGSRSSWVRRVEAGILRFYVKVYLYPTWRARWRGFARNTILRPSRASREAAALRWLRAHGQPAPAPLLVAERRRLGLLHAAVLVTEEFAGEPLDRCLPTLEAAARSRLLTALVAWVDGLHRLGFRDGNLDLRNILRAAGSGAGFAKIDSPRHRLVAPGDSVDRWRRADWRRLEASVAALGYELPVPAAVRS